MNVGKDRGRGALPASRLVDGLTVFAQRENAVSRDHKQQAPASGEAAMVMDVVAVRLCCGAVYACRHLDETSVEGCS